MVFPNVPATTRNGFGLFYEAVETSGGQKAILPPSSTRVKSLLPGSHALGLQVHVFN